MFTGLGHRWFRERDEYSENIFSLTFAEISPVLIVLFEQSKLICILHKLIFSYSPSFRETNEKSNGVTTPSVQLRAVELSTENEL